MIERRALYSLITSITLPYGYNLNCWIDQITLNSSSSLKLCFFTFCKNCEAIATVCHPSENNCSGDAPRFSDCVHYWPGHSFSFFFKLKFSQIFFFRFSSSKQIHLEFRIFATGETGSGAVWSINLMANMVFGNKITSKRQYTFFMLSHHCLLCRTFPARMKM